MACSDMGLPPAMSDVSMYPIDLRRDGLVLKADGEVVLDELLLRVIVLEALPLALRRMFMLDAEGDIRDGTMMVR